MKGRNGFFESVTAGLMEVLQKLVRLLHINKGFPKKGPNIPNADTFPAFVSFRRRAPCSPAKVDQCILTRENKRLPSR